MKNFTLPLAFSLCFAWTMIVTSVPLAFDLFRNVNVEMPAVTILSLNLLHLPFLLLCTAGVILSGLLLAQHKSFGWYSSLAVCLLCDFLIFSFALPFSVLAKWKLVSTSAILNNSGVLLLIVSVVLVQALLATLCIKRRELMQPTLSI
ncbi:MAG TPA: hypothetical protein VF627_05440 [Abditibacterium sp.]|jgi:hypothetical protein